MGLTEIKYECSVSFFIADRCFSVKVKANLFVF
jgi:hypothetical protein